MRLTKKPAKYARVAEFLTDTLQRQDPTIDGVAIDDNGYEVFVIYSTPRRRAVRHFLPPEDLNKILTWFAQVEENPTTAPESIEFKLQVPDDGNIRMLQHGSDKRQ